MNKLKNWINISSIAMILLGVVHLLATYMVAPMFSNLNEGQFAVFIFMYLGAGVATILPGLVSKLLIGSLIPNGHRARAIILVCAITALLMGIGAVIAMGDNIFAYLMVLISVSLLIPTMLVRKYLVSR